jgi:Zn/Cd-binding protein ZinT
MTVLEEKYMKIGIYLSELFMKHIEYHIEMMNLEDGEFETSKDKNSIESIAEKIKNYLYKRLGDDYTRSDLCNNIRKLTAKNFNEAMEYAMEEYPYITCQKGSAGSNFYMYHILPENLDKEENRLKWEEEKVVIIPPKKTELEDPDDMDLSALFDDN